MFPTILEDTFSCNNYTQRRFRIQWMENGKRHGRSWNFNETNKDQRRAEAESFRKQLIQQIPIKVNYSEVRKGTSGVFYIRWTEDDTHRTKSFNFTAKSYADQKAKSLAFKNQLEMHLKEMRITM